MLPRFLPLAAVATLPMLAGPPVLDGLAFGLKPDTGQDVTLALQALLDGARKKPGTQVRLAPGTYVLRPEQALRRTHEQSNTTVRRPRAYGLLLEDHRGTVLSGQGATLLCHGEMSTLGLIRCEDVVIEGLTLAWARPLTTEARVEALEPTGQVVRIDTAAYPVKVQDGFLHGVVEGQAGRVWSAMEIDARDGRNLRDLAWGSVKAEDLGGGRFRLFNAWKLASTERVLALRHHERSHAGVFGEGGQGLTFRDVTMLGNCGLGYLFQQVKDITLLRAHVHAPKGRFVGPKDDAFHFSGVSGLVKIEGCRVADTPDDPVNVHGTCLPVMRQIAPDTLRAHFAHDQAPAQPLWGKPGDAVAINSRETLLTLQRNTIRSYRLITDREVEITFAHPLAAPVTPDMVVENLSDYPEVEIRGCDFGNNRARGILVSTPRRVLIEDTRFRVQGAAILIPGDANGWFESGAVQDITVRRCTFDNCLVSWTQFSDAVISIWPEVKTREPGRFFHRNIRITGNTFKVFDTALLFADNTEGLSFTGNRILRKRDYEPWLKQKPAFFIRHCQDVDLRGNTVEGELLSTEIRLQDTPEAAVKVDGPFRIRKPLP